VTGAGPAPGPAPVDGPAGVPGYRSDLLDALVRVMGLWTGGDLMASIARRAGVDLDAPAIVVMTVLWRHGPRRPSDVAEHLSTGASNVSKILGRLETRGLVERRPDPDDARASRVHLTPAGVDVARRFVEGGDRLVDELLAGWDVADRRALAGLLRRFESATEDHLHRD